MKHLLQYSFSLFFLLGILTPLKAAIDPAAFQTDFESFKRNYVEIASAAYSDSSSGANRLLRAIHEFTKKPSRKSFEAAKAAWLKAREAYGPTEVFRFADGPIEAVEGRVNAWPLDEAYLDYVETSNGQRMYVGIINSPKDFPTSLETETWANLKLALYTKDPSRFVAGSERTSFQKLVKDFNPQAPKAFDEGHILRSLLIESNEFGGEENVSLGFHAIEFLLWGQDHFENSAGQRPWTDYLPETDERKTAIHGERRQRFLLAIADQLARDLRTVADQWQSRSGSYREQFMQKPKAEVLEIVGNNLTQLLGFELAGERMFVAYDAASQEDEHSCFSDNTHRDILLNLQGARNILEGNFQAVFSDQKIEGFGYVDWLRSIQPGLGIQLLDKVSSIEQLIESYMSIEGENLSFDQIITAESLFDEPSLTKIQEYTVLNPAWSADPDLRRSMAKARLYLSVRELYDQSDLIKLSLNEIKASPAWTTEVEL